ncbi:MAG TPA: hypothetical protein VM619_04075 [Luteimonas sp.]|nr:hypothetical protein [Luteimonas sp.]
MDAERRVETLVYRTISFEVPAFDKLKAYQRQMETQRGRPMTNSEVLAELLAQVPPPSDH